MKYQVPEGFVVQDFLTSCSDGGVRLEADEVNTPDGYLILEGTALEVVLEPEIADKRAIVTAAAENQGGTPA